MSKKAMIFRCRNEMCSNEIDPDIDLICKSCRERLSPEDSYVEFGCSIPIRFNTSEGVKRIEPGKKYDQYLNEI